MIRKTLLAATLTVGSMMIATAPAHATGDHGKGGGKGHHTHYCGCGHKTCGGSSGGSSGGTSSSGGSTSGGTQVPEPGMVGILGLGLIGMAYARRRRAR
jgi:hypothetical protein